MNTNKITIMSFLVLFATLFVGCGGELKNIDKYIEEYKGEKQFSVVLDDMDINGSFSESYRHKYKIIRMKNDTTPYVTEIDWQDVSKEFYMKNRSNLEMCILEKTADGKISKVASPPGYDFVGNPQYGEWTKEETTSHRSGGGSFWMFYGRYMFLSHMLRSSSRPIYQNEHSRYRSGGYYGKKSYYGSSNGTTGSTYGTNSTHTKSARPNFFKRKAARAKSKSKSPSRSRPGGRSRGGGFGK